MLTEGTYRTEVSASFELSGVYTAPLVKLWWMIVVRDDFLDFRILGFGPFCHSTPPYAKTDKAVGLTPPKWCQLQPLETFLWRYGQKRRI
jgi:hypothetical protein